jgi:hypothetical protein
MRLLKIKSLKIIIISILSKMMKFILARIHHKYISHLRMLR